MPLFFWIDLFLEARAEILEKISLIFWKNFWHQKDILKVTDLYKVVLNKNEKKELDQGTLNIYNQLLLPVSLA